MSSSTEIDAAKLVEMRSQDNDVKTFARRMAVDHTKPTAQLKMAVPRGVTVPKDNSDTAVLDSLKGLRGKEFDIAYLQQVALAGHKKAVEVFRNEADGGQNADLKKGRAKKALPTIEGHLHNQQPR
jgi:predicted outer membrane protein